MEVVDEGEIGNLGVVEVCDDRNSGHKEKKSKKASIAKVAGRFDFMLKFEIISQAQIKQQSPFLQSQNFYDCEACTYSTLSHK